MSRTTQYRQQVADFRNRLNNIINGAGPASGRTQIDTTGNRSRAVPHSNLEERMVWYGQRRHNSAARIMALFEIARISEQLDTLPRRIRAQPGSAIWQAFQGTTTENACHTCPTHLQLDSRLPTQITTNNGLQRYIIIEFADCMLMPRSINEVDMVVDELAGREAFADASECVLNESGCHWQQGLEMYKSGMRVLLDEVPDMLLQDQHYQATDTANQMRLDMLSGYYEGLFLQNENQIQMRNFIAQVQQEMSHF